jgi:hypothetical protein
MQKIKLIQAVALKMSLEKRLHTIDLLLSKNNSIVAGNKRDVDMNKLLVEKNLLSDLLINLHVAITKTNLLKGKDEEHCNTYYIKKLSELEKSLSFFLKLNTKSGTQIINKESGKTLQFDAFINGSQVNESIETLQTEIATIKNKLTDFNNNMFVEVEIAPSLNIVI